MTCPKCEALRAEVAFLRGALSRARDVSRIATFREEFGLTPRSAALLNALYQAGGEVLTHEALKRLILEDRGDGDNLVRVYIGRIRDVLGEDSVPNVRGAGYRLSPGGLARVAAVLSGEDLAAHAPGIAA